MVALIILFAVFKKYSYLAALGLSCGMWDLHYDMLTLNCSMWDLVPGPGIQPRLPALGVRSLSHWTGRKVPLLQSLDQILDPWIPRPLDQIPRSNLPRTNDSVLLD